MDVREPAKVRRQHDADHGSVCTSTEDVTHDPPGAPLPDGVARGDEPFLVIGAIAGG